jgi:hypothetical protein
MVKDTAIYGINVLVFIDQAPEWAGGGDHTAANPKAYGSLMGEVARQLRGLGPERDSPAYELMNEPNGLNENGRT